jgi:hypothetical protein
MIALLIVVPLHAGDLQPGQVVSSGGRGCQLDALPLPGGFAVYDHAGNLLDQQAPSPGSSTLRHLIGVGNGVAGVPDGGTNESAIATVDADGNRSPFAAPLAGLSSASILGLAPAGRNAIYAVVGSEVWRIERSAGVTLKRQLPARTGAPLALDTDASGCTLYYTTDSGRIARFNVCTDTSSSDFGGGASFAAAEIRVLPDGGIVEYDRSKLQRYDRNGALIRELPLDVLLPARSPEFFASIEAIALDTDPRFAWILVFDGNPCGGSMPLLINLGSGYVSNTPFPNFAINRDLSLAVTGGWSAASSSAPPSRRRAVAPAG